CRGAWMARHRAPAGPDAVLEVNGGGSEPPVLQLVADPLEPPELTLQVIASEHHPGAVDGDQLAPRLADLDLGQPGPLEHALVGIGDRQPLPEAGGGARGVLL